MFKKLSSSLQRQWQRLSTYSGSRRLSLFSLILLFGLDAYVLGLAFNGLADVANTIAFPELKISSGCVHMTEEYAQLPAGERADALRPFVVADEQLPYDWNSYHDFATDETLPVCAQARDELRRYAGNALAKSFADYELRAGKISTLQSEIGELKASYDSALLEKIADQKRGDSILPAAASRIKADMASRATLISSLDRQQASLRQSIDDSAAVREYSAFVAALPYAPAFAQARAEYAHLSFWYPFKVFVAQIAFLLPLLLIAIVWNLRALKAQSHTQTLISSHLILMAAIPFFARFVYLAYELLPHQLLAELTAWLDELNLGFVWNYVAMIGGVLGGLLLILLAQKTFFSPTRQRSARLRKGLCRECGEKLQSPQQAYCEFCGTAQLARCPYCGSSQRLVAWHCSDCGGELGG